MLLLLSTWWGPKLKDPNDSNWMATLTSIVFLDCKFKSISGQTLKWVALRDSICFYPNQTKAQQVGQCKGGYHNFLSSNLYSLRSIRGGVGVSNQVGFLDFSKVGTHQSFKGGPCSILLPNKNPVGKFSGISQCRKKHGSQKSRVLDMTCTQSFPVPLWLHYWKHINMGFDIIESNLWFLI